MNVDKDPGLFCGFRAAAEKLCLVVSFCDVSKNRMITWKYLCFSLCPSLLSWQFHVSSKPGLANGFKLYQGYCEEFGNIKCH